MRSKSNAKSRKMSGRARKRKKTSRKVAGLLAACFLLFLAAVYVGGILYFSNHFFFNTRINGQDFSLHTVEEAQFGLHNHIEQYQLKIIDHENNIHIIQGGDISLAFQENEEIAELLNQQRAMEWPASFLSANHTEISFLLEFERTLLEQIIRNFPFVTSEQVMPMNAHSIFDGTKFVIAPEIPGTAIDLEWLSAAIHQAIKNLEEELRLYPLDVLLQPETTADCSLLAAKIERLNSYLSASITYNMREQVVVDGGLIYTWLEIDDQYHVTFLEERVHQWVAEFANLYNTRGTTRTLVTPRGRTTQVTGGEYGWWINQEETANALVAHIRAGDILYKEPVYFINGTGAEHSFTDWGTTFIQVDLTEQHMWYIVNGQVVFEAPVITGLPGRSPTPQGVYFILYTERDSILRGPPNPETGEYQWESHVSYWMPITWCGIGLHGAIWQVNGFGGQLYRTYGSQGCINLSLSAASELFHMITPFTPVVVHY